MSLKDRIGADISRVFVNMTQFGEEHYWNGVKIYTVPDEEEALKRKNNNVNDISWDNNTRTIMLHVALEGFPGGEPEPNTHVILDRKPMKVLEVSNNLGMLDIVLTSADAREVV